MIPIKDGRFEPDDAVECAVCDWTGRFEETETVPCPGGRTHACPGCGHRGKIRLTDADVEVTETTQATLGESER